MATSPHQPKSLSDRITELKEELVGKKNLRSQMEVVGQTTAGGGMSTTYPSYREISERISWLEAQIESLVAQLNGDEMQPPGVNLLQTRSDYS